MRGMIKHGPPQVEQEVEEDEYKAQPLLYRGPVIQPYLSIGAHQEVV